MTSGAFTHIAVYTRSALAEQTSPVALVINNAESTVVSISFPDFDLDEGDIGGQHAEAVVEQHK